MRSSALLAGLPLVLALVACSSDADRRKEAPAVRGGSEDSKASALQAGFGGVVEVTFSTEDATVQDALGSAGGLYDGRRAGLPASPLPPTVRWYPQPSDVDAAIACMERQQGALRVLLPL